MFATPVDPERDNCPTYTKVIEHPMDFGTVRKKLESNRYKTIEQWKDDVELIFENSYKFNTRQSLISMLAKQLQTIFHELTENLTSNYKIDWIVQLHQLKTELNNIYQNGPKGYVQNSEVVRKTASALGKEKSSDKQLSQDKAQKHKVKSKLNEEEEKKLIEDVNNLSDEEQIRKAVELIKKYEPEISDVEDGEIEVDISKLSSNTLLSLKKLVEIGRASCRERV